MTNEFQPAHFKHGLDISWRDHPLTDGAAINHYHEYYEFFLFLGKSMRYFVKDRTYTISKYSMVFVDKNTYHHSEYFRSGCNERVLICFDDTIFNWIGNEIARKKITELFGNRVAMLSMEEGSKLAHMLLNEILPQFTREDDDSDIGRLRATIRVVDIFLLLSEMEENKMLTQTQCISGKTEDRVAEIVQYIDDNYTKKMSLTDISTSLYLSKYYMCRIFKKATGLSIIDFLNRKRLAEAELMLRCTSKAVTTIAMSVGYDNTNYFATLFKAMYGLSPSQYRDTQSQQ